MAAFFCRALLAAGARCVLVSLWPVPDTAVKLIMKALYSSLLQVSHLKNHFNTQSVSGTVTIKF